MKKPVFYGVGHAIVDYLYDDRLLKSKSSFSLPKPLVENNNIHVSIEEFDSVLKSLSAICPTWTTDGEANRFPGGVVANVLRAASAVGASCKFTGTVGSFQGKRDSDALFFQQKLTNCGVATELATMPGPTGKFLAIDSPVKAGIASPSVATQIAVQQIDYLYIEKADCVITEGMVFNNIGVFNRLTELCLTHEKPLAIDISTTKLAEPMALTLPKLAKQIPLIIFANKVEADALSSSGIDAPSFTSTNLYPIYINMLGPVGCTVRVSGTTYSVPTKEITAFDDTGAGDTFIGAFLTAWFSATEDKQNIRYLQKCLDFANKAASLVLDQPLCTLIKERFDALQHPTC